MARGVNKVILVGNLGNDPELRHLQNGDAVANLTVATSESWNDKNTGQKVEKVEWHRIVLFKKLAEISAQYLRKGSQVYLEGKIQTKKWQDQTGQDRYTTEIVCHEMQMLGGRGDAAPAQQQQQAQQQGGFNGNRTQSNYQQANVRPPNIINPPANQTRGNPVFEEFDDDMPF